MFLTTRKIIKIYNITLYEFHLLLQEKVLGPQFRLDNKIYLLKEKNVTDFFEAHPKEKLNDLLENLKTKYKKHNMYRCKIPLHEKEIFSETDSLRYSNLNYKSFQKLKKHPNFPRCIQKTARGYYYKAKEIRDFFNNLF